jgi:uncharacterized protein (TIGR00290 family)
LSRQSKVLLSWSSGKDSAWALQVLRGQPDIELAGLLTTFNQQADRVAMHAVRRELVEMQATAVSLPLFPVDLPWPCPNEEYEKILTGALIELKNRLSITHVAFGDLYLEDVRAYREKQMGSLGLTPLFPIWGQPTNELAQQMVGAGVKAWLTCVDPKQLPREFAGRAYDDRLLGELPGAVDSCGENGEFHTFAWDGPMFASPVHVSVGERVERDGFVFTDLMPG